MLVFRRTFALELYVAIPTPVLVINKSYLHFDEISCPDLDFPCLNVLPYARLANLF